MLTRASEGAFNLKTVGSFSKIGFLCCKKRNHDSSESLDEVPVAQQAKTVPSACSWTHGSFVISFDGSTFSPKIFNLILDTSAEIIASSDFCGFHQRNRNNRNGSSVKSSEIDDLMQKLR